MISLNTPATMDYAGTNSVSVFAIPFPTFEAANIEVSIIDPSFVETLLISGTHYTLVGAIGTPSAAISVSLVNAVRLWLTAGKLKNLYTLRIKFTAVASQPAKFRDLGRFSPEVFEKVLDRLTMNIKAVKDKADSAVTLINGMDVLPPLAGNAGKILQVNPGATGLEYGQTTVSLAADKAAAAASAAAALVSKNSADIAKSGAETAKTGAESAATASAVSAAAALTHKNNAETAATGAGVSQGAAAGSASAAVTSAGQAAASAAAASTAQGFRDQAETHKIAAAASAAAALTSENNAETAETNALSSKNDSQASAVASQASAVASQASAVEADSAVDYAELYADDAYDFRNDAEIFANQMTYTKTKELTFADSPYTVDEDLDEDVLFIVDDSGGNVLMYLPLIFNTADNIAWKISAIKASASANTITINPIGGDTINSVATSVIAAPDVGALFYANSPTDWKLRRFISAAAVVSGESDSIINALIFG